MENVLAAADMAREQADAAAVTAPVPFCVAKAEQMSGQNALAKVKAADSAFSRSEFVMEADWATDGDSRTPDHAIACARALHKATPGA